MLAIEARSFLDDQMQSRWPNWKPTPEQVADWTLWLTPYDYDTARNAVREHVGSQGRFNKEPNPTQLRPLLAKFQPHKDKEQTGQADPTVFVFYAGGGPGTLLSGYFFPVIVKYGNLMKVAEAVRLKHAELYGGEWRVYGDTTPAAMVILRRDEDIKRQNRKE